MSKKLFFVVALLAMLSTAVPFAAAQDGGEAEALLADIEFTGSLYGIAIPVELIKDTSSETTVYTANVHTNLSDFTYIPVVADESYTLEIDGSPATSGEAYAASIAEDEGLVSITLTVTTPEGDSEVSTLNIDKRDRSAEYLATDIGNGIYRILDYAGAAGEEDLYLVLGEEKALLIDLGMPTSGDLVGFVKGLTDLPIEVALTHGHGDHTAQLPSVLAEGWTVYMSENDQFMIGNTDNPVDFSTFVWVVEGDVIDLGGRQLQVIDVPGHSPGSIVFLDDANKLMLTGDALGSGSGVWAQLSSSLPLDQVAVSYAHLESIAVEYDELQLLPGHGWQMVVPLEGQNGIQFITDMRMTAEQIVGGELVGEEYSVSPGSLLASYGLGSIVYDPEKITSAE